MRILIQVHPEIRDQLLRDRVEPQLTRAGLEYEILPPQLPGEPAALPQGDFVLVLGGDGTFLAGAAVASAQDIPVIGVELGQLGFLCQLPIERLPEILARVRDGDYQIELRPILECAVEGPGRAPAKYRVTNDVVVGKAGLVKMILATVWVEDELLATFKADGIIVASATGSTAYSLSAGGPLLEPTMEAMVITPICAHTLYAKPFVVDGGRRISVRVEQDEPAAFVSADGREVARLRTQDRLQVKLFERPLRVARVEHPSLFRVLREKFGWGFEFKRNRD